MRPRRLAVSLVGVLSATLFAELAIGRLGMHLAGDFLIPRRAQVGLAMASAFVFHAVSLLAVLLASLALLRLLAQPALLPPGVGALRMAARAITVVAMVGFVFISVVGLWQPLPPQLRLYLGLLFAVLVVQLARSAWPSTIARGKVRVWLVLLMAAVILHFLWMVISELRLDSQMHVGRVLLTLGQSLAATVAASAPLLLLGRRPRLRWPLTVGLGVAVAATLTAARDWMLAAKVAAYGFGIELPTSIGGVALEAAALGAWLGAVVAMLGEAGPPRLRGWGLLLLGLSGYHLEQPYQVCASLVGLLCVVESFRRERVVVVPPESWDKLLRRLAVAGGSAEAIVVGAPGFEQVRVTGSREGVPTELLAERRGGEVQRIDLAVGHAPVDQAPPLSLLRRGTPRLGRRAGVEVVTGDLTFDACFVVFDARRLDAADRLLDDATRPRLTAAIDGWLGVWPGRGARLRSVGAGTLGRLVNEGPAGNDLNALIALLDDLRRAG